MVEADQLDPVLRAGDFPVGGEPSLRAAVGGRDGARAFDALQALAVLPQGGVEKPHDPVEPHAHVGERLVVVEREAVQICEHCIFTIRRFLCLYLDRAPWCMIRVRHYGLGLNRPLKLPLNNEALEWSKRPGPPHV